MNLVMDVDFVLCSAKRIFAIRKNVIFTAIVTGRSLSNSAFLC